MGIHFSLLSPPLYKREHTRVAAMAPSFARSISFPLSPSRPSSSSVAASGHARSVSLPCQSHPILAHLHIRAVRSWAQDPASGLSHVDALHAALADLLDFPEAQAALSAAASTDRLLDAFLRLADAHGSFQEAVLQLKQDVADALASALRSQRRAGKELASAARPSRLGFGGGGSAAEVEVVGLLAESAALFNIVAAMSASAEVCSCKRTAALMCLVNKVSSSEEKGKESSMALMERLEELQECIDELESGCDKPRAHKGRTAQRPHLRY
jgi:hypothetical protein